MLAHGDEDQLQERVVVSVAGYNYTCSEFWKGDKDKERVIGIGDASDIDHSGFMFPTC